MWTESQKVLGGEVSQRLNEQQHRAAQISPGPEILKQQPDSKMEKGDILKMTVCFLRRLQQQHHAVDSAAVDQGYSKCVQEVVHFLSKEEVKTLSQRRLLTHFNQLKSPSEKNLRNLNFSALSSTVQSSPTKDKNPVNSALWRTW
ncbi:transcription factor HES-5-like [Xenentodon cancila]